MRRKKMSRRASHKNFRKGMKTHKRNIRIKPQRGGIRA